MGVLAVVGAKGGPGATTAALALALGWPVPVLVADVDPGGGDVAPGWLAGRAGLDRGLLGFAAATRHLDGAPGRELAGVLAGQVVAVPEAPGLLLLPGLAHGGQAAAVDAPAWVRLARAVAVGPGPGAGWVDVLVDGGRLGPGTPWPLLATADVVLLVVRPTVRGCHHGCHVIAALDAGLGGVGRVGLAVCGPGPYPAAEVGLALGLPVRVALPADPGAALVLTDGVHGGRGLARTGLLRAARTAARTLHTALTAPTPAASAADVVSAGWR